MENSEEKIEKSENIEKSASIRGFEYEYVPHSGTTGIDKELFTNSGSANVETLYTVLKNSPEVVGCIMAVVEDIVADGLRIDGAVSPKKKTETFISNSRFYKILTNAIIDLLVTGNAYILKLSVDEDKMKSIITSLTKNLAERFNVQLNKELTYEYVKQDMALPKDLQLLKSSTVRINFDETGLVSSYEQQAQGKKRVFKAKDVIHLSLMNIGGQPYGFTPLEPLLSDIATLIYAKEFAGKYFENDGLPGWHFNLPEENPDSRNYKLLKKEIQEMKKSKNKHRILLTTGKLVAEQINKFNKDMEFSKLIMHFTQIILMAMGVPAHRVNLTMEIKGSALELGKVEAGYYKKIAFMQKLIENDLNSELFREFNVKMKFNRGYKIDEMREAQIAQIMSQIGAMTTEEIRERIGLEPKMPSGTTPNSVGDDKAIDFEQDKKRIQGRDKPKPIPTDNKVKKLKIQKEVQTETVKKKVRIPKRKKTSEPEIEKKEFEIEKKEIKQEQKTPLNKMIEESVSLDWMSFRGVVENKVGKDGFDLAKILYTETKDGLVLFFSDEQWKYMTLIDSKNFDIEKFKVENLRYAIKVFM